MTAAQATTDVATVAVTGASGRLGAAVVQRLVGDAREVRALDIVDTTAPLGALFHRTDLRDGRTVSAALDGADVLVHVAGVHGAHLLAGTPRTDFWTVNVECTWRLFRQAVRAGVRRIVFASSSSVYGPGTRSGEARVLDEDTPIAPEDIYDQTKVLGERMLAYLAATTGVETVALRLGRFYYGSHLDYHLRKLSTGLDLYDAVEAFARCVDAAVLPHHTYCVASDLTDLSIEQRKALGTRLRGVVEETVPELADAADRLGFALPERFGKSTVTERLRADLGWVPARDIRWWAGTLLARLSAGRTPSGQPMPAGVGEPRAT